MSKPTYSTSNGERYTTTAIDRRVRDAKLKKLLEIDNCCERCDTNQGHLHMSHIVSVKEAKENGWSEICWDVKNLELLCVKCHLEIESRTAEKRLEHYHNRK